VIGPPKQLRISRQAMWGSSPRPPSAYQEKSGKQEGRVWQASTPMHGQNTCVFGASDIVRNDEVPNPCLHVPSPQQSSAHAVATSLADSDDVPILRIQPRSAVVSCDSDDEVLVPRPIT
jgi:hypothetical protein